MTSTHLPSTAERVRQSILELPKRVLTHQLHSEGIAKEVLRGLVVDRALNGSKDPNAVALLHVVACDGATRSVRIRNTFEKIVSTRSNYGECASVPGRSTRTAPVARAFE